MVKANYAAVFGAFLLGAGLGGARAADDAIGVWATEKHESQIKIVRCGKDSICGTVAWMRDPYDAKGNPRLDRENEDEAKRKRLILGLPLLNMKPDEDHWKGTIYNAQNGKTYDATLKMLSHNEARIEGCVAYVLCGGQKWTREEPRVLAPAPAHVSGTSSAPPPE